MKKPYETAYSFAASLPPSNSNYICVGTIPYLLFTALYLKTHCSVHGGIRVKTFDCRLYL